MTPAKRLDALLTERHITYVQFAAMLENEGHHITPKQLVRAIGDYCNPHMTRKHITPDLLAASERVLGTPV